MSPDQDTIAAIATPVGRAGIGIIRVSGPLSLEIAGKIFIPRNPARRLRSHRLYLGRLVEPSSGDTVDEVLLSFMKAPRTYTREDVLEINSHSGFALLTKILYILLDQGARLARPGEFTLRAFLNGRIDLTQAEAVMDIINSRSERGLYLASQQVKGLFREKIEGLRQRALQILARAEMEIDFPEEDSDLVFREEGADQINRSLVEPVQSLIEAHGSRVWVDGINAVIAGRVNAGKSSLLNRLVEEERAIVTPVPGTTRDVIECTVNIDGIPFKLMDTAGFRSVSNEVERLGIGLTTKRLAESDLVLIVIDRSRPIDKDDLDAIHRCREKKALMVLNKIDLPSGLDPGDRAALSLFPSVQTSALTGRGIDQMKQAMKGTALEDHRLDPNTSNAVPNLRHRQALETALGFFREAAERTKDGFPMEIVALELRSGLDALGEITGETTDEDLLNTIFSQFCIGK